MTKSGLRDCILIIDSSQDVVLPLAAFFRELGVDVMTAADQAAGLDLAGQLRPDLILLAATVNGQDGLDVLHRLRAIPRTAHIPVMFLASRQDSERQNELLAAGAADVIMSPYDLEILSLRIRNTINRARRDSMIDTVTGLPTGALLEDQIRRLRREPDWCALTVQIDGYDDFQAGHDFLSGSEALRYAATTISELAGAEAFVGCLGEARFAVLLACTDVRAFADKLVSTLQPGLLQFYTFMEREQGYVLQDGGAADAVRGPLMAVRVTAGIR
ncbi:MAG: response regulator [Anaerolineae bacterium]|nr:response regulator [Anaerolineae bacterium]